jgi:DNA polymerase-1
MRDLLFIDGFNLFLRYFVVSETTNAAGELVGGFTGFLKGLKFLVKTYKPQQVFVVWEQGGACPRRKKIFPEYKENRFKNKQINSLVNKESDSPLADTKNRIFQLQLLTKALGFLPVCQVYVSETECDDVIGYLVKRKFADYEGNKVIVSSDKDFYQLLDYPNVKIYDPGKKHEINKEYVLEHIGISPKNITLARTLCGDPSDNVPGVPGMGFKTLLKHFPEFKTEEIDLTSSWLLERANGLIEASGKKPLKVIHELVQSEEVINRNWQLMYLDTNTLSYYQIEKIDGKIESFKPICNKLEYLKIFTANDVSVTQDLDSLPTEMRFIGI